MMQSKSIYFDNSATTALSEGVKKVMTEAMDVYGNPSSLHLAGLEAEKLIREARKNVAMALGIRQLKDSQLVFTSCGSEATSLALFGTAYAKENRRANKILTSDSEHPSVENPLRRLEKEGFVVVRIPTVGGVLDLDRVEADADGVLLATFMLVNNETGALYDVRSAFDAVRRKSPDAVTHCDAVQGFLKEHFTVSSLGADLITLSAHKIHGPKGVGALYIDPDIIKKKRIVPFLLGGGQEYGLRSGTENTVGIAGFGEAAREGYAELSRSTANMRELREYIIGNLPEEIRVNQPRGKCAPHIINVTLPNIKSETMLHFLSSKGIFISSGSACSSHSSSPSTALTAFGLSAKEADSSIRISLSASSSIEEGDSLCSALAEGLRVLVRVK